MAEPIKILFVCGRNQRRSPTAEKIFDSDLRMSVRSAGTSASSKKRVSRKDLDWADLVLVMERKYTSRIRALFPSETLPPQRSLDIPDDYEFMAPELIELLVAAVEQEISTVKAAK